MAHSASITLMTVHRMVVTMELVSMALINSFTCECNPGFNGSSCEIDVNECEGKFDK